MVKQLSKVVAVSQDTSLENNKSGETGKTENNPQQQSPPSAAVQSSGGASMTRKMASKMATKVAYIDVIMTTLFLTWQL